MCVEDMEGSWKLIQLSYGVLIRSFPHHNMRLHTLVLQTPGLVSAVDDCKEVDLTFEDKDAPVCSAIISIKAVALGCGSHIVEDTTTTTLNFTVAVDGDRPLVTCDLGTQGTFSQIHTEHCLLKASALDPTHLLLLLNCSHM